MPGAGIALKNNWKQAAGKGIFLFSVIVMSTVFRAKSMGQVGSFIASCGMNYTQNPNSKLYAKSWAVYANPPFGSPQGVIVY